MMTEGFLFYALIFLLAAVIVVPIAKRTGLGAILGYLLAGVAIGPYVLGLIDKPDDILHFSEFGIVLMLFLIGIELQPATLWRLRKSILGLGASQVLISILLLGSVIHLFGISWPVSLAIGMAVSLSSTAITIQLMAERNLLPTYTGQSSFSILLFQDIAVIPILAAIPLLAAVTTGETLSDAILNASGGGDSLWEETLKVVGLVSLLGIIGHYGLRHILRFIAQTRVPEIFTATALLLVVGVAFLMQTIGLSPALGAFIAGVILADSEYRHEIEAQIKPFKALLLGLFFISVGMSINFTVLSSHIGIVALSTVMLISLKFIAIVGIGRFMFGMKSHQYVLLGTLLAQGGEFAFVISQYAYQVNLFSTDIANVVNVTVAISMLVTPLLMILYDKVATKRFSSFTPIDLAKINDNPPLEQNPVIIIGYGRFGQIVGRLLHVNNIPTTILDHDPDNIEFLRKFGYKVFYGDASDMELLESAGANKASLLVLAVDDPENTLKTAKRIRDTFPDLKIYARARDRRSAYELSKIGVHYFEREMFESSIHMGQEVLKALGYNDEAAHTLSQKFAKHDRKTLRESFAHFEDEEALISFANSAREELQAIFEADRKDADLNKDTPEPEPQK